MDKFIQEFLITGETPAKKNSRITLRNGMTIPSKNFRAWHDRALIETIQQKAMNEIQVPVRITLTFTHGDLRRRDSDNGTSSIMDLLVDAKILKDDNWQIVKEIVVKNEYKKNESYVCILIEEL